MTCRDIESLMLAERDGAQTPTERAALSDHLATCPACRELRTRLAASLKAYHASAATVRVPDVDEAWREVQARLHAPTAGKKHPLAPVIWFGAPLAAAAALAFVFLAGGSPFSRHAGGEAQERVGIASAELPPPPPPPPPASPAARSVTPAHLSTPYDPSIIAGADYVEAGNPNASTMVYVDKESGWLVVWVTDVDAGPRG